MQIPTLVRSTRGAVRALVSAVCVSAGIAHAGPAGRLVDPVVAPGLSAPVDDRRLGLQRGGYESADGRISVGFGLQQSVYVDSELKQHLRIDSFDAGVSVQLSDGSGNGLDGAGAAAVIQNQLSGTRIHVLRVIDVTVDSLRHLKQDALQRSIVGGVIGSLGR